MKSLLILGKGDTDYTDRNPRRLLEYAKDAKHEAAHIDYDHLINPRADKVSFSNPNLNVMLFFPYTFWNENCETPKDNSLYGTSKDTFITFCNFFSDVKEAITKSYSDHNINYIIDPEFCAFDRDKVATIDALRKHGIPTTDTIAYSSLDDILDQLSSDIYSRGIYIKCRYGAEGKGITLLRKDQWLTNYSINKGKLGNYESRKKWKFTDITGRKDLLSTLLESEIIAEWEIRSPGIFPGHKTDIRAYVVNSKPVHFFSRINVEENVVTNFSQGGKIRHSPNSGYPNEYIEAINLTAVFAADALSMKFAGIDIMFDTGSAIIDPRVIEVQAFTDFPDIACFDLARYIVSERSGLLR